MQRHVQSVQPDDHRHQYQYDRDCFTVQIRKKKREREFNNKRKMMVERRKDQNGKDQERREGMHVLEGKEEQCTCLNGVGQNGLVDMAKISQIVADPTYLLQILTIDRQHFTLQMLPDLIPLLYTQDHPSQIYASMGIRRLLSHSSHPPTSQLFSYNILPILLKLLQQKDKPQVQMQLGWILTNLAAQCSKQQTQNIVEQNTIQILVNILKSKPIALITQQIIWAIGNLICDCHSARSQLFNCSGLSTILQLVKQYKQVEGILEEILWCIAIVCKGRPLPQYQDVKEAVNVLIQVVSQEGRVKNCNSLADCLWAISYHCQYEEKAEKIMKMGLASQRIKNCQEYIKNIDNNEQNVALIPSIRIIGQMTYQSTHYTTPLIHTYNILDLYLNLCLKTTSSFLKKQSVWALANLTAGPLQHTITILENKELISLMIEMFYNEKEEIRNQVSYFFGNMINIQEKSILQILVEMQLLPCWVQLMESQEQTYILGALEHIEKMLRTALKDNQDTLDWLIDQLWECQAIDILQTLQYSSNQEIYQKVNTILTYYFHFEDPLETKTKQNQNNEIVRSNKKELQSKGIGIEESQYVDQILIDNGYADLVQIKEEILEERRREKERRWKLFEQQEKEGKEKELRRQE